MRAALAEVVLDEPDGVEAELVGELASARSPRGRRAARARAGRTGAAAVPRLRGVDLVEQVELHAGSPSRVVASIGAKHRTRSGPRSDGRTLRDDRPRHDDVRATAAVGAGAGPHRPRPPASAALWFTESGRTAYLSCAAAALATDRIGLGTAVAVAFPRSPMVTAKIAWELAGEPATGGSRSGSAPRSRPTSSGATRRSTCRPGPRMRDYVQRAAGDLRGVPRRGRSTYEGDYYNFSLLPAQWSPGTDRGRRPADLRRRGAAVDVGDGRRAVRRRPRAPVPLRRLPARRADPQRARGRGAGRPLARRRHLRDPGDDGDRRDRRGDRDDPRARPRR